MADYQELVNRRIFDRLKRLKREKLSRNIGLVTDDSPFTVEIAGVEHVGLQKLGTYTPTIGDRVWISRADGDLLVHGDIA